MSVIRMYYVYIIKSRDYPEIIYTGFSTDLRKRFMDHNRGKSKHSEKYRPWELIFYCAFTNKQKALNFEAYLKSGSGIAFKIKRLI